MAVVMFVEINNADKNLLSKSAEQSPMDKLAPSLFADSLGKISVSGLRAEASPEYNVEKLLSEGPPFKRSRIEWL